MSKVVDYPYDILTDSVIVLNAIYVNIIHVLIWIYWIQRSNIFMIISVEAFEQIDQM